MQVDYTDWGAVSAGIPTLVILMAGKKLPDICEKLTQHGWAADTPVAVIREAGGVEQRVWHADLATVVQATAGVALSPCIVVVGRVTSLPGVWQAAAAQQVEEG